MLAPTPAIVALPSVFDVEDPIVRHAIYCARHCDPGSEAERLIAPLLNLDDAELYRSLLRGGYQGRILTERSVIIGHIFFQDRYPTRHIFSVAVLDPVRQRCGIGSQLFVAVLQDSRSAGFGAVRMAAGGSEGTTRLWMRARDGRLPDLKFPLAASREPEQIGWLYLVA